MSKRIMSKRSIILTLTVVAIASMATSANAATILSDDFDGVDVSVLGEAPDVAPSGEVWVGYTAFGSVGVKANGDFSGGGSAYLPFTPVAGNVYTLSADVNGTAGAPWSYFGFISDNPAGQNLRHDSMGSYGSFLYYNTTSPGANLITYYGENMNGNLTHSGVCVAGVNNLKAVLDATDADSANWTMELFLNGTSIRAAATAPSGDYGNIGYAGFNNIAGGLTGTVDNFLLVDNSPESPTVDAVDYIALKTHMGQDTSAGATEGDFDDDGDVDWDDLQILQGRFRELNDAGPVPEPATLFIMLGAGLPALLRRRRSRG